MIMTTATMKMTGKEEVYVVVVVVVVVGAVMWRRRRQRWIMIMIGARLIKTMAVVSHTDRVCAS
jgi:putative copper export protein